MKIVGVDEGLCYSCFRVHEILIIEEPRTEIFEDTIVSYPANFEYCIYNKVKVETNPMKLVNDLSMRAKYQEILKINKKNKHK